MHMTIRNSSFTGSSLLAIALCSSPVWAQDNTPASAQGQAASAAEAEQSGDEIVVTARKRGESLLSVPATVAAVTGEQLTARGITNLEGVARTVPSLMIADSSGSPQGGAIGLRGISAGEGINFADQAVGFYVDNVLVARSTPRRFATYDIQQIEILKGPQPLYYGKNSPGGIVTIRTADPTDQFEAKVQAGYEFNAREVQLEGYVSGPLTDSLGIRIAAQGSGMRGWVHNDATVTGTIYDPADENRIGPDDKLFSIRGTLKYDDGGPFSARFKYSYGKATSDGVFQTTQLVDCPTGVAQAGSPTDLCRADDRYVRSDLGTILGTVNSGFEEGVPRSYTEQHLGGLDLAYDISDGLTLTSTTGYFKMGFLQLDNATVADTTKLNNIVAVKTELKIREISEEVRLTSSFNGPFNFMVGGYYQNQKLSQPLVASFGVVNPFIVQGPAEARGSTNAWSVFASASYKPLETVEISGGARYSKEKKRFNFYRNTAGTAGALAFLPGDVVPNSRPERSFDNISPEATIAWRPDTNVTLFGTWKRGFLSGGFNPAPSGLGTGLPIGDRSYDDQNVAGFEIGAKAELLDRALRLNFAAFTYKINDLQVASNIAATSTSFIGNAASARTKGFEFDATYKTPLNGLSLNGGIAYNKATYIAYNTSPCYAGQSIAQGCNLGLNTAGTAFTVQDLAGKPLVRAPLWGASLGANYDYEDGSGNKMGFSVNGNYSSKLETQALGNPGSIQPAYWLLDASARYELSSGIEFSLLGRNLTNKYYFQRSSDVPGTGVGPGRISGGSIRGDTSAAVSRGREIVVRFSYSFY
jgi:iron complex outermembrane receptor protein